MQTSRDILVGSVGQPILTRPDEQHALPRQDVLDCSLKDLWEMNMNVLNVIEDSLKRVGMKVTRYKADNKPECFYIEYDGQTTVLICHEFSTLIHAVEVKDENPVRKR